jgi:hypothetical protein
MNNKAIICNKTKEQVDLPVALYIFIREVLGSNIGWDTVYPHQGFSFFPSVPLVNAAI